MTVTELARDENRIMTVDARVRRSTLTRTAKPIDPRAQQGALARDRARARAGASASGCRAARSTARAACRRTRGRATRRRRSPCAICSRGAARSRRDALDGVTISGGEPFEQPDGAARAARRPRRVAARARRSTSTSSATAAIRCARSRSDHARPARAARRDHPRALRRRPAARQRLARLAQPAARAAVRARPRALRRRTSTRRADAHGKRMQAAVEGGRVWMIGIPGRGDMARGRGAVREPRARRSTEVSWRR